MPVRMNETTYFYRTSILHVSKQAQNSHEGISDFGYHRYLSLSWKPVTKIVIAVGFIKTILHV